MGTSKLPPLKMLDIQASDPNCSIDSAVSCMTNSSTQVLLHRIAGSRLVSSSSSGRGITLLLLLLCSLLLRAGSRRQVRIVGPLFVINMDYEGGGGNLSTRVADLGLKRRKRLGPFLLMLLGSGILFEGCSDREGRAHSPEGGVKAKPLPSPLGCPPWGSLLCTAPIHPSSPPPRP